MAGFSSMPALSSGAAPGPDSMSISASEMEAFDASMAFDDSMLSVHPPYLFDNDGHANHTSPASDPVNVPQIPFTPTAYDFENFSTTFEDPFSYPARPFDGTGRSHSRGPHDAAAAPTDSHRSHHDLYGHMGIGGASPQDDDDEGPDNKLLSFGPPIPGKATLLTDTGQFVEPAMTGELYGMFFVAEDVFGADSNATGRPLELTCYRRNLWQISGQITLPRHVAQYVDDQGRRGPVVELAASITAVESIEGRAAEMITIPWRGSNAPLGAEESKAVSAPPVVPLDFSGSGQEVDGGSRVSVPVAWKRLQFKHATANNGRRKGLQQHYVVQINLLVKSKAGEYIKVAEIQSGPVIVRGRSPRNFDSRKEVPLGDKRPLERRNTEGSGSAAAKQEKQERQDDGTPVKTQRYNPTTGVQQSPSDRATPYGMNTPNPQHPNKKLAVTSPNVNRPPVPSWGSLEPPSSANAKQNNAGNANPNAAAVRQRSNSTTGPQPLPLSLSLSEDERSPPNRSSSNDSSQSPRLTTKASTRSSTGGGAGLASAGQAGSSSGAHDHLGGSLDSDDMLYEYFPLSLDDWMPPVDAIYRPHVVHHTIVPPEVKAQQVRSKAKRYFAAE
ncbi:hypothetical protein MYCTH_108157 [Thermothelomyces thermophilus ATCC 42464]|uniref:NDT80 domain-containing protein n=1 Tax=Thermothelomyces thermophilus (strain ATCC 42464 / BCRC 31852 / DSM 1799) TaxID=573729 RepID=G2QET8_THET4|nr:uncharacterized protein MYCTH_108157 [Thermothelomyces thermophilus ATCC 42464]AEO58967.1 hypothetical protein MYCTH_108157 [Thermothelomyces thermophilus ATCC 42464]